MATSNIGYFVGSLSSTSSNRTLPQALIKQAHKSSHGLLFVAPEVSSSIPGAIGTAVMQSTMRSMPGFLDAPQLNSPTA